MRCLQDSSVSAGGCKGDDHVPLLDDAVDAVGELTVRAVVADRESGAIDERLDLVARKPGGVPGERDGATREQDIPPGRERLRQELRDRALVLDPIRKV